jgi:acetylornithine deacetylase/succinyl-diaminopimelate desuccinylase-like protein
MSVHDYIDANLGRFREELFEFLRIPSVSARSEHRADVAHCAEWLAASMRDVGLKATVEPTAGHPIVVGEYRDAGEAAPTLVIYGHYDVQPAEPLDLWTSPPFQPQLRNGRIYARGSVDDKGQLWLHVKALEAHMKGNGGPPVNVVIVAEGEEEVGSGNLMPFVRDNAGRLAAAGVVVSDSGMVAPGVPTLGTSLRGLAYFELRVKGPAHDLHSGSYGGAVANPATVLGRIIASFHDENRHIAIPGFYDGVVDDPAYRKEINALDFDEAEFLRDTGSRTVAGEAGYTTYERLWVRPTLDVNGLLSGYTGEGSKTVLPAEAMAKVSCRLVPDQDPDDISRLFETHVRRVTPPDVTIEIVRLHGGSPWRARTNGALYEAGRRALQRAFGRPAVAAGEGGSIPIVPEFEHVLDAPALLMGFGLPGENAHAPDEWMSLENFEKGTHAAAALLEEFRRD